MSEYKLGIYRKKNKKGELGKYCFLKIDEEHKHRYNLFDGRRSTNKALNGLYKAMGKRPPYMCFDFDYGWHKEDFHNKYEFIKEGSVSEWEDLEEIRKKANKLANQCSS